MAREGDEPELTHYAALDRSRVRLTKGSWPAAYTASLEMRDRAALELERDHIGVWPDGSGDAK
ncbi:hypothetical protein [Streptomyces sp. NPDC058268]|uniref:hypothetical protein n=1 Tax=Streptomyces sp. NPDC058268 TaxID=3346413 RepID=UPI0036E55342